MKNLITKRQKDRVDSRCKKYQIENYSINSDGSIDVNDFVVINNWGLTKLPLKFRNVSGGFNCDANRLTTLEGSPQSIGGSFYCEENKLSNLDGTPREIGGSLYCGDNKLTSLEGAPNTVGDNFYCSKNKLTNLVGCPTSVGGDFFCDGNQLSSTYSGDNDIEVGGNFHSNDNHLPQLLNDNIVHIKLILKYQRHFVIWNDDLTLNEENFQMLLDEIKDGLL